MVNRKQKNNKRLTPVEAIVIFIIIVLLAAVTLPEFKNFTGEVTDKSRIKETQSVAAAAQSATDKVYKMGASLNDINGSNTAAKNLRKRILAMSGASGKIISFHVSNGSNLKPKVANPAPKNLNFMPPGTVELLEYEGADGIWYGQYRVLSDGSTETRILSTPSRIAVTND